MASQDPGLPRPRAASSAGAAVRADAPALWDVVESLRPAQWVKNGFVFAALIFSRNLTDRHALTLVGGAFLAFCAVSSAAYLLNDVLDAEEDRKHPLKRMRPVAAGRVSPRLAIGASLALALGGFVTAWELDRRFFIVIACYVVLNGLYSSVLKHVALVDVFVVAAGFVLRVLGGGTVIRVQISAWLIVCTTLLALFLALSKRRHELVLLGVDAAEHRPNLVDYSPYFLDQLIAIVTASTVMSYALYTLSPDVRAKFPGKHLELTVPFVLFGIFRYLYLVHQREGGGNPTRLLLTDRVLLAVVLMWTASVILLIYL